jgi:hypothetical protein
VAAVAFAVATTDASLRPGEICSATAGANRVRALIVRPSPINDSVKIAAASESATATITSERFVHRRGGLMRRGRCMLLDVHAPFHVDPATPSVARLRLIAHPFCHNGAKQRGPRTAIFFGIYGYFGELDRRPARSEPGPDRARAMADSV